MGAEPPGSATIPWPRILIEGAVVVLSILLAFGIDAAWDDRQLAAKEAEYLTALRVEMALASEELAEDHGRRDAWIADADSILGQIPVRIAPDSAVNVWMQDVSMFMSRFFPPSSVLGDLVSSGNLSTLSSQELRFALLTYERGRERVNFLEDWAREVDEDGLRPYLTRNFRWTSERPLPLVDGRSLPRDPLEPVPLPPGALDRILADPEFENLILIKRQRLAILQRRSAQLGELIADVIELSGSDP
ncbi:MAG: hypothetical protein ABFS34_04895 [Gemmatimonadota bacterium]